MTTPLETAAEPSDGGGRAAVIALWSGIAIYVGLRVLALVLAPELEDDDSTGYLINAAVLRAGPAYSIPTPDFTPFYPASIVLVGLTRIDLALAARLVSLAFSLLLLVAVIGIGRRIASPMGVALGVLLLAISPSLVPLSVSVLSEPSYVGTVYLGLWLFLRQVDRPRVAWGAALGLIFGLAFLNRIEGLLFLAAIPVLQVAAAYLAEHRDRLPPANLVRWSAAYIFVFLLLAGPQVWWVSHRMGSFSINGRQTWALLDPRFDVRDRERLLNGLDYSPQQENLTYMWTHPEARAKLAAGKSPMVWVKLAVRNADLIYRGHSGYLVGPGAVALFLFGLVAVLRRGSRFPPVLIGGFLATALTAPLFQSNIHLRNLAVLTPLVLLLAGEGISYLAALVAPSGAGIARRLVPVALTGALVMVSVLPLRDSIGVPLNQQYEPASLVEPVRIIREIQDRELHRPAVLCDRTGYLGQASGAMPIFVIPYTDMPGFVRYLALNHVDLLYIDHRSLGTRPFAADFSGPTPPPGFTLLYRGGSPGGNRRELYRVNRSSP
ncbi:MAG TPA: glycosyltransferase family 39 protein [Gemmatimonadales bacterium]|nr:glycosyltransferase family 39 protein [Gemmatimonadales bacterium]